MAAFVFSVAVKGDVDVLPPSTCRGESPIVLYSSTQHLRKRLIGNAALDFGRFLSLFKEMAD